MRAVAVLLVLLNHAEIRGFAGGYVGVDVFFVISGFLITGILVREIERTGTISMANFYARRARRILPAATVALLAIVGASTLVLTSARLQEVMTHTTWAAFFAANVYSSSSGSDYFAEDSFVSPVLHFWSLAVEEQFYLVWPPLIALIVVVTQSRRGSRLERGQSPPAGLTGLRLRRLAVAVAVVCALSFTLSVWQTTTWPMSAYYSTLTRGWELGIGALLALCGGWVGRWPVALKLAASWAGLTAIAVAGFVYSAATPFPGYHAALPVLGAALVVAGGTGEPTYGARLLLDSRPMRWFGDISYSLYLWHWPVLVLAELYVVRALTLTERVVLMAVATLTAWLSYRFVEAPMRHSRLTRGRVRALVLWPTAPAAVVVAVLASGAQSLSPAVATTAPVVADRPSNLPADVDPAVHAVGVSAGLARANRPLPAGLRPALEDLNADVSRVPAGCTVERDEVAVSTCVLGDPNADRTMVLFGDSHVIMWRQPIERLAKAHGWRIIAIMKASCFPLDATVWRTDKQRAYTECDTWREAAYREIARIDPDRIIASGLVPLLTDPKTGKMAREKVTKKLFADGAQRALRRLRSVAPHVDVIGGTPYLEKAAGDCLGTRSATMATCATPVDRVITERNRDWRKAAAAAGAKFIDPMPWLCSNRLCPIVIGDVIVYRDTNHITRTFADTLQPQLARKLNL